MPHPDPTQTLVLLAGIAPTAAKVLTATNYTLWGAAVPQTVVVLVDGQAVAFRTFNGSLAAFAPASIAHIASHADSGHDSRRLQLLGLSAPAPNTSLSLPPSNATAPPNLLSFTVHASNITGYHSLSLIMRSGSSFSVVTRQDLLYLVDSDCLLPGFWLVNGACEPCPPTFCAFCPGAFASELVVADGRLLCACACRWRTHLAE